MSRIELDDDGEGAINFKHDLPRPPVEHRIAGPAPELPPAPRWDFDEKKLRRLLERAEQVSVARRDLAERLRDARSRLQITRSDVMAANGHPHKDTLARQVSLEAEVKRLLAEQQVLDRSAEETIRTARTCEEFARSHGWTPDGRHVPHRGPGVAGA